MHEHGGFETLYGIHGQSRSRYFAVGVNGHTLYNDGSRWITQKNLTTTRRFRGVWCSPSGMAYVASDFGGIARFGS